MYAIDPKSSVKIAMDRYLKRYPLVVVSFSLEIRGRLDQKGGDALACAMPLDVRQTDLLSTLH